MGNNVYKIFLVFVFRQYFEAHRNMQNFHRLFLAQQEKSDRLSLSTSNGGQSTLNYSKQDSEFDSEDLDEKYSSLFPVEPNSKSNSVDVVNFGSGILGTSEMDNKLMDDSVISSTGRHGSFERIRRNSRDLSPLPSRRKIDDATREELVDKEDLFVKPRPPHGSKKVARRLLPLEFNNSKVPLDENSKQDISDNVKRTQSW